jgi:hypothetical protein
LGALQLGARLCRIGGVKRIIDLRQHRSLLDSRTVIYLPSRAIVSQGENSPSHLSTNINYLFRLQRAGGSDR